MVLKLWAPPPERPTARSLAAAAAIATATEVAWILPVLPLVMATAPALPTPPKPLPSRRKPCSPAFCRRIRVLSASDSPTAGAAENWAAGATLTARAAPQAVVVRLLVSLALSVKSPLPRVRVAPSPAPCTSAVTFCLRVFVASEPAPLAATPTDPLPVQAMAAEVAPTVASIVLVWSAFSVSDWATRDFTPARPSWPRTEAPIARPSPLASGPSLLTPRRLRATEAPIETAPPLPVALPWPAPAIACTWAVIVSLLVPERLMLPRSAWMVPAWMVSAHSSAWLPPSMVLRALAPPPARPRENLLPMATPIATATEVESIVRVLVLLRLRSPPTVTLPNPFKAALPSPLRVLLATATPTEGASDKPLPFPA